MKESRHVTIYEAYEDMIRSPYSLAYYELIDSPLRPPTAASYLATRNLGPGRP